MEFMKLLAFLLSPSTAVLGNEVRDHEKYRDDQEWHRMMLAKSMSGGRLKQAFGDVLFSEIWWDNVCPMPTDDDKKFDSKHIDITIKRVDPQIILTFGDVARDAVGKSIGAIKRKVMSCHHPNARYKTQSDLDNFASEVRAKIMELEDFTPERL